MLFRSTASPKLPQEPAADMPPQALPAAFSSRPWPPSLFLGLLCGRKEGIILRQLTFAANLATINKVSVREWRNGIRAGLRNQFFCGFKSHLGYQRQHKNCHICSCGEIGRHDTFRMCILRVRVPPRVPAFGNTIICHHMLQWRNRQTPQT